jgi:cytochrome P450
VNRQNVEHSACAAVDYLLNLQHPDGHWEDYVLPVGTSDQWVTAYVALALARVSRYVRRSSARKAAQKACDWLMLWRSYPEGWGYNANSGPDSDTTAHVLLLLHELGAPTDTTSLDWLEGNWVDESGFATYPRDDAWGIGHPCVTPVAYLALHHAGRRSLAPKVRRVIAATQQSDGGWRSYWWAGHGYADWVTLQLIRAVPELSPSDTAVNRDRARTYTFRSNMELACALGKEALEMGIGEGTFELGEALISSQGEPGGWPGDFDLRVTDPDCYTPWDTPSGSYFRDVDGTITTATSLAVYATCFEQKPDDMDTVFTRVHEGTPVQPFAFDPLPKEDVSYDADRGVWLSTAHASTSAILQTESTFSATVYNETLGRRVGPSLLELDGSAHRMNRRLIRQAVTPIWTSEATRNRVKDIVDSRVEALAHQQTPDLVRTVAFEIPARIALALLNIPDLDEATFVKVAFELVREDVRGHEAAETLDVLLGGLIAARRRSPGEDMVSALLTAEVDGQRLDDEAVVAFCKLLAPAAIETPYHALASLFAGIFSRPGLWAHLAKHHEAIPATVEEGLRWGSVVDAVPRKVTTPTCLAGHDLPAGATIFAGLAAANKDPERYPNPQLFNPARTGPPHLALGAGPHKCLGAALGRMIMIETLTALVRRYPRMELAIPPEDVMMARTDHSRWPISLPVRLTEQAVEEPDAGR